VEKLTGFTFFRTLPAEVATALRDSVDDVQVKTPKGKKDTK
jgi:hypothetical protein